MVVKIKIGYFITKYPYENQSGVKEYVYGGSSMVAYSLANVLATMDNTVNVYTTSTDSKYHSYVKNNVNIYRYGTDVRFLSTNISHDMLIKPRHIDLDIAHVHFDIPPGPLAGYFYKMKNDNVPLIVTYHGDWIGTYGGVLRRAGMFSSQFITEVVLKNADSIISPSTQFLKTSEYLWKYRQKVKVIPNGIDMEDFDIQISKENAKDLLDLPKDKTIILFSGGLVSHKGPEVLLKAFQVALQKNKDMMLVFMGAGPLMNELNEKSIRSRLIDNVKFTGFIDNKSMRAMYYKSADMLVMPSTITESFGMVILESMAAGTPVIASNIGGIPDLITNLENGLLVRPNNEQDLAEAILFLINNDAVSKQLIDNGLRSCANYSWKNIASITKNLYDDLLAAR